MLVGVSVAVCVGALLVALLGWAVEGRMNPRVAALLLLSFMSGAAPFALLRTEKMALPTHLIGAAGTVMMAVNAYTLGGLHGASLTSALVLCLGMFFLGGLRVAAVWTAAGVGVIVVYFVLTRVGHVFPMAIGPEANALMSAVSLVTQLLVVFVLAWLFETERRRAQDSLKESIADLESFARAASHDLRGPATRTKLLVDFLESEHGAELSGGARELMDHLHASADYMTELIDDLLELERVKRAVVERREVDLSGMGRAILAQLQAAEPERRVVATVQAGLAVQADPGMSQVVMRNLLENAWKYTAKRPEAEIELGQAPSGRLFVRDNGAGFPSEKAAVLFEPFQRLHGASQFPGTGVGLATVARIIERHGGAIDAHSDGVAGATFTFDFG